MAGNRLDPLGSPQAQAADPLTRLLGLSTAEDRHTVLQQQLAQAAALRNRPRQRYSTWAGALAGGLGDVVDSVHGTLDERRLRGEESALLADTEARRGEFANLPGVRDRLTAAFSGGPQGYPGEARMESMGEFARAPQPMGQAPAMDPEVAAALGMGDGMEASAIGSAPLMQMDPMQVQGRVPSADPMRMPPMDIQADDPNSPGALFQRMQREPPGPTKDALERQLQAANALRQRAR
jgi:hypothetical protein